MSVPARRMTAQQQPEFVLQDFTGGMHTFGAREALSDNEMWWCENAIPLDRGNLANLKSASTALQTFTDTGSILYAMGFNIGTTPYAFVAFQTSGTGWILNLSANTAVQVISSGLTSPYAVQYSNLGILIIDPSGYWDYNVTTANTLTSQIGAITGGALTNGSGAVISVAMGTTLTNDGLTGGTGGSVFAQYKNNSVTVLAGGTGYVVGDVLTDSSASTPWLGLASNLSQIVVTAVSSGAITGISFVNVGLYQGPATGSSLSVGPGPSTSCFSGGTGTGATFKGFVQATGVFFVVTPGRGYTNGTTTHDKNGATIITTYTITTLAALGGQAIAIYAGRVWIASGRTIYVTEVNSFNFFGGSGSFFTLNDAYLYNNITVLFSANNYLYIFGADSIDVLSNVTVILGVVNFTRLNIVQGVGTSVPASVFAYYRSVAFYDPTGFYFLHGATPEKISEKISSVTSTNNFPLSLNSVYGAPATIKGELCATFSLVISDTFSGQGGNRAVTLVFFRRRWWVYTFGTALNVSAAAPAVVSMNTIGSAAPVNVNAGLFQIGNTTGTTFGVVQALGAAVSSFAPWIVRTRLWDGAAILREKQALNAAVAAITSAAGTSGVTFTVDTENSSSAALTFPLPATNNLYNLMVNAAQGGGGQFLGLTVNGDGTDTSQIDLVALRGLIERDFLQ